MENINVKKASTNSSHLLFKLKFFPQHKEHIAPVLIFIAMPLYTHSHCFITDSEEENDDVKGEAEDLEISDT